MTDDDNVRIISDATRVQRLADSAKLGTTIDVTHDLPAMARELRRTQALVAALDDRLDQ